MDNAITVPDPDGLWLHAAVLAGPLPQTAVTQLLPQPYAGRCGFAGFLILPPSCNNVPIRGLPATAPMPGTFMPTADYHGLTHIRTADANHSRRCTVLGSAFAYAPVGSSFRLTPLAVVPHG